MVYRFIGTESIIGSLKMRRFGQRFQMETKIAETIIKGGCPILPEEDFLAKEFTDEDLQVWSDPMVSEHEMPVDPAEAKRKAEFNQKRNELRALFCERRHDLLEPHDKPNTAATPADAPQAVVEIVEVN